MADSPVSSIRNLGPAVQEACTRAGIASAEALRELGTDAAYARLIRHGTKPHFIGYYVIEMGLQGRPWNDCKGDEKIALRARFDRIVAQAAAERDPDRDAFEAMMDAIGVIEAR